MIKFYSNDDLRAIREAKTYKELLAVAIHVLEVMRNLNPIKHTAIVCGPISTGNQNSREQNLYIFSRAINRISEDGLLIFSQMPFENDMERIYKSDPKLQGLRLLEEFYLPIFQKGFIKLVCFLPGWERSTGASWEHDQAKKLRIPVLYLAQSYVAD